ncbi:autotransporter outer membrane beta-barrel domain-containing protein [Rhodoplanes elegans]|uniref:autotransporter outer membrane beta-barrel domain-containing protein n=1 Tax=Rhodoplanes elegans TaxID=29408 RepID=UPI0011B9411E|nr:autotransporter outer membrane beta-barrel domain-containing protein [Rhodoplanes elegans]
MTKSEQQNERRRVRATLLASTALVMATTLPATGPARAQDATWLANPVSDRYTLGANWSTGSVPAGTAYFDTSAVTTLLFSGNTTVGGWTFNGGASNYSFVNIFQIAFDGAGIVVNGGSATIDNRGVLYFTNTSTAGGASITNRGNLEFFSTSTAGSATIINDGGLFIFHDHSTAGDASITNTALGIVYFSNVSTAGSATITNDNVLYFQNVSTAGNAVVINNGGISFDHSSTAGSATITINGSVTFHDNATAGNAAITNNGGLAFEHSSTAGSATIVNNASVSFLDNSTAGNAAIVNTAGAFVEFSRSMGQNGDGKLTAGSIAGGGTFHLGAVELTVGGNGLSTVVTGVVADGGIGGGSGASLVKTGTGTLTLAGTNTYTGATVVNGGALVVDGSIAASSSLTMTNGTMLAGTGTVPTTIIAGGATLAPGHSIGTLTVAGDLSFAAGSIYRVEVSPSAADRTDVTGVATLTGATVQAVALPGSFRPRSYTIVNAAGGFAGTQFVGLAVTGSFGSDVRNSRLTYDATNAYLVLDPDTLQLPAGASGNQSSVAGAINRAVEGGATPPAGFDVLLNMSGPQLSTALNQISGQPGAAGTQVSLGAMQQFVMVLDPVSGGAGSPGGERGVTAYAPEEAVLRDPAVRAAYAAVTPADARTSQQFDRVGERWGVWASGYGGTSTVDSSGMVGASATTSRVYGTVVGADRRVAPDTRIGIALGGAGFDFSVSDGLGSGRADVFQAGVYGRHAAGPLYLSGALAYGWQDVATERTVSVAGFDKLSSRYKASTLSGRAETGWRIAPWPDAAVGLAPYGALQVSSFHLPGYQESVASGSSQFALAYDSQTTTNLRSELGVRLDAAVPLAHGLLGDGLLTLRGRLAWAHDTNTDRPVTAAFQMLPGATFTVNGTRPAADSALATAGAEMRWRNGVSLAGTFEGEVSNTTRVYAGKGTLRYAW